MRHSYRPAIPPQPQPYRTQVLHHSGNRVAGMFEELGITEVIDQTTQQDPEMRIVTAGPCGQSHGAQRPRLYCLQLGGAKPPPLGGSFSRFSVDCGV